MHRFPIEAPEVETFPWTEFPLVLAINYCIRKFSASEIRPLNIKVRVRENLCSHVEAGRATQAKRDADGLSGRLHAVAQPQAETRARDACPVARQWIARGAGELQAEYLVHFVRLHRHHHVHGDDVGAVVERSHHPLSALGHVERHITCARAHFVVRVDARAFRQPHVAPLELMV